MLSIKRLAWLAMVAGVTALVGSLVFTGGTGKSEASVSVLTLNLVGSQENPPVAGTGTATVRLQFDDVSKIMKYDVTTSGIDPSQVTMGHLHRGAVGVNGPVIYPFTMVAPGVFSGQATISDADIAEMRAGGFYANVHSVANPGGFARAQFTLPGAATAPATTGAVSPPKTGDAGLVADNSRDVNLGLLLVGVVLLTAGAGTLAVRRARN